MIRFIALLFATFLSSYAIEWKSDYSQAQALAQETGKPILVLFMRQNCPFCHRLEAETLSSPVIQKAIREGYIPLWIDTQKTPEQVRETGVRIRGVPTAVLMRDGQVNAQMVGFRDPMGMMGFLQ